MHASQQKPKRRRRREGRGRISRPCSHKGEEKEEEEKGAALLFSILHDSLLSPSAVCFYFGGGERRDLESRLLNVSELGAALWARLSPVKLNHDNIV